MLPDTPRTEPVEVLTIDNETGPADHLQKSPIRIVDEDNRKTHMRVESMTPVEITNLNLSVEGQEKERKRGTSMTTGLY